MTPEDFNWFNIFNRADFEALDLVSREVEVVLEGVGLVTFLITKGNQVCLTYDGVMLPVEMRTANPYYFEDYAILVDENDDVYWGVPIAD